MPLGRPPRVPPDALSWKGKGTPPLASGVIAATKWMLPVKLIVSPVHGLRMVAVSGTVTFCTTAADDVAGNDTSTAGGKKPPTKRPIYSPPQQPPRRATPLNHPPFVTR